LELGKGLRVKFLKNFFQLISLSREEGFIGQPWFGTQKRKRIIFLWKERRDRNYPQWIKVEGHKARRRGELFQN